MARGPIVVVVASVIGCSSSSDPGPPAPCTVTVGAGDADLVLDGHGSCAGTTTLRLRVATGDPASPIWADVASAPVRVGGRWSLKNDAVVREITLENPGGADVKVVGLEWTADPIGVPADRLLHGGYQSWTYTGVETIPEKVGEALGTAQPGGDGEDAVTEKAGVSWWLGAVMDEKGQGLFAAAEGATVLPTFIAVDRTAPKTRLRIVQGMRGDVVSLAAGQKRALDGLRLAVGDVPAHLDAWAKQVAARFPPSIPRRAALAGWGSWNVHYTKIDATKLRDEAAWASKTLAPLGMKTLLLDDGYEPNWGAWQASTAFGAELATLNAEQAALGLEPAVWLAPIYVDTKDPLVASKGDWFVRKPTGELRTFTNFGPTYAALDVTHPDARKFVTDAIARYKAWGYKAIKIDFLFGAAIAGVRQEPITGLESYARWMKAIREAAGDMHVVGCGAPILPSVGFVDSMRTGPDVAFDLSPEATYGFLASQARHTAFRAFTDAWWSLDPDVVILRGKNIDDAEAWTFVVSSLLAGGNWLSGDGRQASAARLAMTLAPEVLALARDGQAARPIDFAAQADERPVGSPVLLGSAPVGVPHVWRKAHALAVFAWDDPSFSRDVALPAGARELVPEGGKVVSKPAPSGPITVPSHGARLFVF
ncbi:MAG: hypothetical protein IPJ34_28450 [Myxococcales bacterium]|nr:hypothetical protein [Myxococcales bacterium]